MDAPSRDRGRVTRIHGHRRGSGPDSRKARSLPTRVRMIDPRTNPGSEEHESIERYDLEVAPRVRNLPPYLFGRINELKYRKRQDGDRRDRPGDGKSHRPARGVGGRQALRGGARLAEPPLQRRHRHLQPAPGGRPAVPVAVRRQPRPRPRGRRDDRVEGRLQPHVPGPPELGRHGAGPRAQLPGPHPRDRAGLRQRDLARRPGFRVLPGQRSPGRARACIRGRRSWS